MIGSVGTMTGQKSGRIGDTDGIPRNSILHLCSIILLKASKVLLYSLGLHNLSAAAEAFGQILE